MWVLAKDLVKGGFVSINGDEMFEVNEKFEYWPFDPKSVKDFKKRTNYGHIEGDKMVMYYIAALAESVELVEEYRKDHRSFNIVNPKRASHGSVSFPLTKFKLQKETSKAKDNKQKQNEAMRERKRTLEDKIADQFKKNASRTKEGLGSGRKDEKQDSSNDIETVGGGGTEDVSQPETKDDSKERNVDGSKEVNGTVDESLTTPSDESKERNVDGPKELLGTEGESEPEMLKDKSTERTVDGPKELRGTEGNSQPETPKDENSVRNEEGSTRNDCARCQELQEKLKFACDSLEASEQQRRLLEEELKERKSNETLPSNLLEELKSLKSGIKECNENLTEKCTLSQMKSAVPPRRDLSDVVECSGFQISKEKITEVEFKTVRFSGRVLGMAESFWPGKVHLMHLNSGKDDTPQDQIITATQVQAMTNILNTMDWTQNEIKSAYKTLFPKKFKVMNWEKLDIKHPVTTSMVSAQLRKTTYNARDVHMRGQMSKSEYEGVKKKRAQKRKEKSQSDVYIKEKKGKTENENTGEEGIADKVNTEGDTEPEGSEVDGGESQESQEYLLVTAKSSEDLESDHEQK